MWNIYCVAIYDLITLKDSIIVNKLIVYQNMKHKNKLQNLKEFIFYNNK